MQEKSTIKLFISYTHNDEDYIDDFRTHLAPLKTNRLIEDWYDRKILGGQDFQKHIDSNLEDADIICLLISAKFLNSTACLKEIDDSIALKLRKGTTVLPIILSQCGWTDNKDISKLLAFPTDGKEVASFKRSDEAWHIVYNGIKDMVDEVNKINNLKNTKDFTSFLSDADLLSKAHSNKEKVGIDDIFVYPELIKYDDLKEENEKENAEDVINNFLNCSKILIAGEDQSGKTSLCKKMYKSLRNKKLIPVYISDKNKELLGSIENKISKALSHQYEDLTIDQIDRERIVPIIDNFHLAKHKEKIIMGLAGYRHQIVIVDDIFGLNFKDENLIKSFTHYEIKEWKPSLRNELILKWINLSDKKDVSQAYQSIDRNTELVNSSLGKIIGTGIMPSYPFFILSVLSAYDTFEKPLDQEITSQGHCYQALIYMYLYNQNVKNLDIDAYINFLTEISFHFFTEKKVELSPQEFESFFKDIYLEKFILPIKKEDLFTNLNKTKMLVLDDLGNWSFAYDYLFYFFVGKYLAEHLDANKGIVDTIINNLHKDENAYIAIFISHHSKDQYILDEIQLNAMTLFDDFEAATLSKDELQFFDDQTELIIKAVLPSGASTPEQERDKRLKKQDAVEDKKDLPQVAKKDEKRDSLSNNLRRSFKTVEVMGLILKNRAGSLEKKKLEEVFKEAMNIQLKIISSFLALIKDEQQQVQIVEFLTKKLDAVIKGNKGEFSKEKLEKISRNIFWNTNFAVIYTMINKTIHSLGSSNLTQVVEQVCDKANTPASFLIKHGILMWYNKNLQTNNIIKVVEKDNFSKTARHILNYQIVNHCSMHSVGHKQKNKISSSLKIPTKKLIKKKTD